MDIPILSAVLNKKCSPFRLLAAANVEQLQQGYQQHYREPRSDTQSSVSTKISTSLRGSCSLSNLNVFTKNR